MLCDPRCGTYYLHNANPIEEERTLLARGETELNQHCRRWRPALMSFFLKRTHDHAEAEDLTQETFARLFGGTATETGVHAGYVFQVAANLLRDRARRRKVRTDGQEALDQIYGQSVDWIDPEKIAAGRGALTSLIAGLAELPERTRTIFVLYRVENIGKALIAESFGISPSAVEKHVTRAMRHLMARAREQDQ